MGARHLTGAGADGDAGTGMADLAGTTAVGSARAAHPRSDRNARTAGPGRAALRHRSSMPAMSALATGNARNTAGATRGRAVAGAGAGAGTRRSAPTLRRPVAGRRLVRRRTLPVRPGRPGRRGVRNGSGAGAGPVSAGPATDAVGVGSEAGIGRRLATHPAKLPS